MIADHLMNTYARLPVTFTRGEGAWLYDSKGGAYLDSMSGIGVCSLGHAHPAVTEAIRAQAGELIHVSNTAEIPAQRALADRLCPIAGMDRAFFCNSGAEANECALKIARRHGHERGIESPEVIVMEHAFHGRTLAMISASGNRRIQAGFEPLVPGFLRVPYGDTQAVERVGGRNNNVAAVMVEPIQGEGGVLLPPAGYLKALRELCDANGWLLICDEIQTGLCKTGAWYAFQHEGIQPDMVTSAKALGNGVPIGACLARGEAADLLTPGKHGSTFGGNPLACRVADTVLRTMAEEQLAERARDAGERLDALTRERLAGLDGIEAFRGRGLMRAIVMEQPCRDIKERALEHGLLLNVTQDRIIRLLPPLILTDDELEQLADRLARVLHAYKPNRGTR